MGNHPNRGPGVDGRNPEPEEVRALRIEAGLTQTEAGAVVHTSLRAWQQWESGERRMHPAFWELFQRKVSRAVARGAG